MKLSANPALMIIDAQEGIETTQKVLLSLNLPYNIPISSVHETGNPKSTLPQRRRDAKFRRVALRNFAPLRLRGEKELYILTITSLRSNQILYNRRSLKSKISKSKIE